MYTIAEVWDYKGGELSMNTNISRKEVIETLTESLYNVFEYQADDLLDEDEKPTKEMVLKALEENRDDEYFSIYAGGECGFCGEIYEHIDNKLVEVPVETFFEEIAIKIVSYYDED